jgi:hypothetical protein
VALNVIAIILAGFAAYPLEFRGLSLITVFFLLWFPIRIVVMLISIWVFAPDVEATGAFHAILYDEQIATTESSPPVEAIAQGTDTTERIFHLRPERTSLEGAAILLFFAVIALFAAWSFVEPVVYNVWPGLTATRTGPKGFPMEVTIAQERLLFSNPTSERLSCRVELGDGDHYRSEFVVGRQATKPLAYGTFQYVGNGHAGDASPLLAREKITLTCDEESGLSHFVIF